MASTVYSLVKQGDIYRLSYLSKNAITGLTNITAKVLTPAGIAGTTIPWDGSNPANGFVEGANGWYYTDINTTGLALGAWHYIVDHNILLAPAATRIQVFDGATMNDTAFEALMTSVGTAVSELQNGTYGLSALETRLDGIEGATFSSSTDSLEAIRDYLSNTILSAISGIKNNVSCATSVPEQVIIPASSSITRRLYITTYGESGEVNEPDAAPTVQAFGPTGTNVTDSYFTQGGSAGDPIPMTKNADGQYYIDMIVESTDTPTMLNVKFSWTEATVARVRWDDVSLVGSSTDVTSVLNDMKGATFNTSTDSLEAIRNALDSYLQNGGTIDTLIDTLTSDIAAVKLVVDGIQTDLSNSTDGLGALKILIDAIQTDLSNGTDGLGAIKAAVDANNLLLSDATYGLSALQQLISGTGGLTTDLSDIKGTGFATGTDSLKQISDRIYAGGIAF